MKELHCKDAGVDCDFVARGETEDELFQKAAEHGRTAHQMESISDELKSKMKLMIRDV
jgi:predicted small metal-binding protein